jgi:hypothetical protein
MIALRMKLSNSRLGKNPGSASGLERPRSAGLLPIALLNARQSTAILKSAGSFRKPASISRPSLGFGPVSLIHPRLCGCRTMGKIDQVLRGRSILRASSLT